MNTDTHDLILRRPEGPSRRVNSTVTRAPNRHSRAGGNPDFASLRGGFNAEGAEEESEN